MWDEEDDIDAAPEPGAKYVTAAVSILLMLWLVLVAGCGATTETAPGVDEPTELDNPRLYKDRTTGCQYLSSYHDGALTPRIAADGKTHMGCKAANLLFRTSLK